MTSKDKMGGSRSSLVKVQLSVSVNGVNLLKRFAEALRDAERAEGAQPLLPTIELGDDKESATLEMSMKGTSVFVPNSGVHKIKAYARMLRFASRSGRPLPKFKLANRQPESISTPKYTLNPPPVIQPDRLDVAKIRQGMKTAREARDV